MGSVRKPSASRPLALPRLVPPGQGEDGHARGEAERDEQPPVRHGGGPAEGRIGGEGAEQRQPQRDDGDVPGRAVPADRQREDGVPQRHGDGRDQGIPAQRSPHRGRFHPRDGIEERGPEQSGDKRDGSHPGVVPHGLLLTLVCGESNRTARAACKEW